MENGGWEGSTSSWLKRLWYVTAHSSPSSAAVKKKWSYTSTTLSAAQNKKLRMRLVNNQPKGCAWKQLWEYFRYQPGICLNWEKRWETAVGRVSLRAKIWNGVSWIQSRCTALWMATFGILILTSDEIQYFLAESNYEEGSIRSRTLLQFIAAMSS